MLGRHKLLKIDVEFVRLVKELQHKLGFAWLHKTLRVEVVEEEFLAQLPQGMLVFGVASERGQWAQAEQAIGCYLAADESLQHMSL